MTSHEKDFMESVMAHINSSFLFFLFFFRDGFGISWSLSPLLSEVNLKNSRSLVSWMFSTAQANTSQCVGGKFLESPDNRTVQTFQKSEPQGISLQELLLLKVENNGILVGNLNLKTCDYFLRSLNDLSLSGLKLSEIMILHDIAPLCTK